MKLTKAHFFESEEIKESEKKESVRSKAMSKKDIDILREAIKDSHSFAKALWKSRLTR